MSGTDLWEPLGSTPPGPPGPLGLRGAFLAALTINLRACWQLLSGRRKEVNNLLYALEIDGAAWIK